MCRKNTIKLGPSVSNMVIWHKGPRISTIPEESEIDLERQLDVPSKCLHWWAPNPFCVPDLFQSNISSQLDWKTRKQPPHRRANVTPRSRVPTCGPMYGRLVCSTRSNRASKVSMPSSPLEKKFILIHATVNILTSIAREL